MNIIRDAELVLILTQLRGQLERMSEKLDDAERVIKEDINERARAEARKRLGPLSMLERA